VVNPIDRRGENTVAPVLDIPAGVRAKALAFGAGQWPRREITVLRLADG
jgi:hypothetical protein